MKDSLSSPEQIPTAPTGTKAAPAKVRSVVAVTAPVDELNVKRRMNAVPFASHRTSSVKSKSD